MVTIKITHQNTFRRFVLSNDATWSDLETKLRSLFPIPASTPFTLSYVDEDNDVITLSTDLELREVLSPQLHTSTIKFNLKFPTTTDATSDGEDSNSEAWIFEGVKTPPQPTASVVGTVGIDGPDNVSQKNITSTTNQEAQQIESDSEEVSSNKKSLLDDDLYEEGSSSIKKNTMDEFYKSFDSLGFVPIITPINEDKGKQKEAIGESSSPTLTTPITSPASSSLILLLEDQPDNQPPQVNQNNQPPQVNQNNQPPQVNQNNQPPQVNQNSQPPIQPPQVNQNNQPPQEPELSVYELADNFQKMFDKFKKNNPELMGQLYQLISANFSPQDRPQENQSQNNQHQQESRDQRQQYYSLSSQPSQSRRNNDDFFDNPPTLFSRPQIPGSFPAPPRTTQSVQQCPWAGQARSDSDLFESNNNTRGSVRQNKYRRNRRRRHNHHNREYEDRHEQREETQETQEEEREETEETLEAREAARELQRAARERELQRETQEVQRETSPYQEQIESLTSMGLCSNENEDQCTELLTIYEGNVQQVIEYLLEGQQP